MRVKTFSAPTGRGMFILGKKLFKMESYEKPLFILSLVILKGFDVENN